MCVKFVNLKTRVGKLKKEEVCPISILKLLFEYKNKIDDFKNNDKRYNM